MNQHIKSVLLLASILVLLVSACDVQSLDAVGAAGAPMTELPPSTQTGLRPTPTPEGDVGDGDKVTAIESSQAGQAAPSLAEPASGAEPENIPSEKERNAILDRVIRGGPVLPGSDEVVDEGPAPGTESVVGPVNTFNDLNSESIPVNPQGPDLSESAESFQASQVLAGPKEPVSGEEPENVPSEEERNAILDKVKRGGPVLPGSDEVAGEGPAPRTESDVGHKVEREDILDWVNSFVETLRNWWHKLRN